MHLKAKEQRYSKIIMAEPLVCIVVLNWNGKRFLEKCLATLKKTTYKNYKIIIADNGSTDGSIEYVKKQKGVDLLALGKNYGFAGGNNHGAEYALKKYKCKYVLWLNNDTEIIQPGWLNILVETAERSQSTGIVGCKLLFPDGRIQHAGAYFHPIKVAGHRGVLEQDYGQYDEEKEMDYVTAACIMVKKDLIDKIGLMDEGYFPIYFEEADYCIKAKKAGFKILYTGHAKLIHHTSATTSQEQEDKRYYIWEKNRIRFVKRNFSIFWKPFAYARILAGAIISRAPIQRLKTLCKAWKDSK